MTDAITHVFGCTALFIVSGAITFFALIGFDTIYQEIRQWWKHRRGK
nr:MAG TPA_asm: transmembrane protein [Caudoviricetes sp.]